MKILRRLGLVVVLSLGTFVTAESQDSSNSLTLTHVNVVDVRAGKIVRDQTVQISNGLIRSVAHGSKASASGRIVDGQGRFLIPGLWDMHVHSALTPIWDEKAIYALYIANGVTGIRDMGGDVDLLIQRRSRIERGEILGPHMVMAGPFLAGGKASNDTIPVKNAEDARQAVDTLVKRGVDFIKILTNLSRESYFAVAEESAQQKITFVGHVPTAVSVAEASNAGQRSIEHLTGVSLACSSQEEEIRQQMLEASAKRDYSASVTLGERVLHTYDAGKAQRLFAELRKNNTWQVPTLVWTKADSSPDDPQILHDDRLKYVPAKVKAGWDPKETLQQTSAELLQLGKEQMQRNVELVRSMHAAGVPFLAGSDGPDPFVYPGFSLHDELEWLVKAGFSPAEALQAATLRPAEFLGKVDRYGTIEPGRAADLVLLDGDPLADIRNTRKISHVIVGGTVYSRAELDRILGQVEELVRNQ